MTRRVFITVATLALLTGGASAQVPSLVGFQGFLTDLDGNAVDAPEGLTVGVAMYHEASGGDSFWSDEYESVVVRAGSFSLLLGAGNNALPGDQFTGGTKYLALSVNGSPELEPRLQIISVPYAMRADAAQTAVTAQTAATLDGFTADQFAKTAAIGGVNDQIDSLNQEIAGLKSKVDQLENLFKNPGCVDECSTGSVGCSEDLGQTWTCGDGGDEDPCNEQLFDSCPGAQKCCDGSPSCGAASLGVCQCLPAFEDVCIGNDAFEQDSCAKPGKLIAKCGEGLCNDGVCVNWARQTPLQLPGMRGAITVADNLYIAGQNGEVVHYDGATWTNMATGTDKNLHAITGYEKAGEIFLFAVGQDGKLIEYKGGNWSTVITGSYQTLNGIFHFSPTFIVAVGANGTVLRYDGKDWAPELWDSDDSWKNTHFNAVWADSPSQIWVAGENGTIIHWDGEEWEQQASPNGQVVRSLWGVSDQSVWAGTDGQIWLLKDGGWTVEFDAGVNIHAVWGDTESEPGSVTVYAAGDNTSVFKRDAVGWGKQNPVTDGFPTTAHFRALIGGSAPAGGIWVVAQDGRVAYRDTSGKWVFPALTRQVRAFFGVSGDASNQFAMGSDCLALRQVGGEWLEASIDDGACADGTGEHDFLAMWGTGSGDTIFAVGEGGLFKTWDGTAWLDLLPEQAFTPNSNAHRDIWGLDAANLFLVQDSATFIWNGIQWQTTAGGGGVSGAGSSMTDFHTVDGSSGAVKSFDGSEWSSVTLTDESLRDIWGTSATDMWVVGTNGAVYHFDGGDWNNESIPDDVLAGSGTQLNAVWTTNPVPVYVAADNGHSYLRSGGTWTNERTFPTKHHNIVYGADGGNVLLGGAGTIYRRN